MGSFFTRDVVLQTGVNYEGGKIIKHVIDKYQDKLAGYAHFQIAMDAPFDNLEADDKFRSKGQSEKMMPDYDEIVSKMTIFNAISEVVKFACTKNIHAIVFQIARGRSGKSFFNNDILPVLQMLGDIEFEHISDERYHMFKFIACNVEKTVIVNYGYKSSDYFNMERDYPFIYVNIGMFARLELCPHITAGMLCVPVETYSIIMENGRQVRGEGEIFVEDILLSSKYNFEKIRLLGLHDDMPFVTTEHYRREDFF